MNRLKLTPLLLVFLHLTLAQMSLSAQEKQMQTIRGKVTDSESQEPLIGVSISIDEARTRGSITDAKGEFELMNIPVGRHTLRFSYLGYVPLTLPEVLVGSGKEIVLNVSMIEDLINLQEVVVTNNSNQGEAINSMVTTSARGFNVEQTRRYAGGLDDPARLASVFAGVATTGNVESNAIIIRGNAPTGVMWQVEGVEVATPSHFTNADVMGGGAVSLFSNQILSNSSFYTGAFPAEFGNASAGVFDINLRSGNNRKYEHSVSVGMLGVEASTEGPFKKGSDASYLVNYRYSTFGLVKAFLPQQGLPVYQDLCFKINLPTKRLGTFSLWGIGGLDNYSNEAKKDPSEWTDSHSRLDLNSTYYPGSIGLRHKITLGEKTYLQSTLAASSYSSEDNTEWIGQDLKMYPKDNSRYSTYKFTFKSVANHKFNASLSNRTGVIINNYQYDYKIKHAFNSGDTISPMIELADNKGNSMSYQAFTQFKYDFNPKLSVNAGVHAMYFGLNNQSAIEPRLGARYNLNSKNSFSFAYGLHSQLQMLNVYFLEKRDNNGTKIFPNKSLDFTKSHHFVFGYDYSIHNNARLKVEAYYQHLYNIPVEANGSFALTNLEEPHGFDKVLQNTGTGYNYGVDITLERFLNRGFYYLATLSLFQSKYKGGDGIERNTLYNYNYVANLLAGKEWTIGKGKNNLLGLSGRFYLKGGDRQTPIDLAASLANKEVVLDESRAFESSTPMLYRFDLSATYRINKRKVSHIFAVQLINALSSPSLHKREFNYITNSVEEVVKGEPFPSISWKVEF